MKPTVYKDRIKGGNDWKHLIASPMGNKHIVIQNNLGHTIDIVTQIVGDTIIYTLYTVENP